MTIWQIVLIQNIQFYSIEVPHQGQLKQSNCSGFGRTSFAKKISSTQTHHNYTLNG